MLPGKAKFTSRKMFSVKCPLRLLELDIQKQLMICKKYTFPLVNIETFCELSDETHTQCLYLQKRLDERKDRKSETKPAFVISGSSKQ